MGPPPAYQWSGCLTIEEAVAGGRHQLPVRTQFAIYATRCWEEASLERASPTKEPRSADLPCSFVQVTLLLGRGSPVLWPS